jgi:hypothetical protein
MKLAQCGHVQEMQDNQIQEMMLDDWTATKCDVSKTTSWIQANVDRENRNWEVPAAVQKLMTIGLSVFLSVESVSPATRPRFIHKL